MKEMLKNKGYKATPARLAILNIFTKNNTPITAEKILRELKRNNKNKNINEATVYRTLTILEEGGIIKRVDLRKGASFFELVKEHHHHITCLKCDTVEDFESKVIENVLAGVARNSSKFTDIKEHSLELFGVCRNCIA